MKPVLNRRRCKFAAKLARLGLGSALLLGLSACQPTSPASAYFPLAEGHGWTYQVTTAFENNKTEREILVIRNVGSAALADGPAWQRQSDAGMNYWLRQDETGIYRVASRHALHAQYQADTPVRYVLKAPLQVGTQWSASTTAYLLHRPHEFPREIRHTHPSVPMHYTLAAVKQPIDTLAGRFDDCLLVKGLGVVRLFVDPVAGIKDMPLTTREWYCAGVGLVKLIRDEPAGSTFLGGATMTLELTTWQ